MEIGSKNGYPASTLSNFHPHKFIFDGVECNSIEGVLQSFKFDKEHIQIEVCKLVGFAAKKRGKNRNKAWQRLQRLWWKGVEYDRHGIEYQKLLNRLYIAVYTQCESFRNALAATKNTVLKHSIGRSNPHETILTEREFVVRLTRLREKLLFSK